VRLRDVDQKKTKNIGYVVIPKTFTRLLLETEVFCGRALGGGSGKKKKTKKPERKVAGRTNTSMPLRPTVENT